MSCAAWSPTYCSAWLLAYRLRRETCGHLAAIVNASSWRAYR